MRIDENFKLIIWKFDRVLIYIDIFYDIVIRLIIIVVYLERRRFRIGQCYERDFILRGRDSGVFQREYEYCGFYYCDLFFLQGVVCCDRGIYNQQYGGQVILAVQIGGDGYRRIN